MAAVNFPDPSQSPWENPDNGVIYVYSNNTWSVLGGKDSITINDPNAVKLDDGGTKQVIESAGLGISDGTDENITLDSSGNATFQGSILTGPNTGSGSNNATGMTIDGRTGRGQLSIIKSEDDTQAMAKPFLSCIATDGTPTSLIELKADGKITAQSFDLESLQELP